MSSSDNAQASLQHILAAGGARKTWWRRPWLLAGAAVVLLALLAWLFSGGDDNTVTYKTDKAVTDTLVVTVSATGNLQPTNQVEVGSETSGIIEEVLAEENDHVKQGQILARLDLSRLTDAVTEAKASLAVAEAQVLETVASHGEVAADLKRLQEVEKLSGGKIPSRSEMVAAEAAVQRAEAAMASARAGVVQARARLESSKTSLAKGYIRSPIDGVVLTRSIEPGQTVAASFQAPVLFILAENLAKMELQVDIDEADVGQVAAGQKATFSVDAWPGREYPATITKVGIGVTPVEEGATSSGVVSYPATLALDNSDLSLRPGMTATAVITTLVHEKALLVPNAALRFTPPQPASVSNGSSKQSFSVSSMFMPRGPSVRSNAGKENGKAGSRQVWVLRDDQPVAIPVQTGASNGRYTEILSGDVQPGMELMTESGNAAP